MKLAAYFGSLFRSLFHREESDRDLDEELREHIRRYADDCERAGLSRPEAERRARIAFGSPEKVKERVREQRPGFSLETLAADVRLALRILRKAPGFTSVATLTLALGIGANTAIFSIINTTLLRPLPYRNPANLVWAGERFPVIHGAASVISPDFIGWRDHNQVFDQIEGFASGSGANLVAGAGPARVAVTNVTPGFFSLLGVKPIVGRTFLPAEGREGKNQVALLGESLWRGHLAADPLICGKTIRLDDNLFTVVGVLPATLRYPSADLWTPLDMNADTFSPQSPRWRALTAIARLKPGVDTAEAQSDLQLITLGMDRLYPPEAAGFRKNVRVEILSLHSLLVENVRSLLLILLGAVACILLIAAPTLPTFFSLTG